MTSEHSDRAEITPRLPPLHVAPMTRDHAVDICTWRYASPYDCYDMTDADPDELFEEIRLEMAATMPLAEEAWEALSLLGAQTPRPPHVGTRGTRARRCRDRCWPAS